MWTSADYELDWPAELLRGELLALITHPFRAWTAGQVELLLTEAFHTGDPVADFTRVSRADVPAGNPTTGREWINGLLARLDQLREYAEPQPYWAARRAGLAGAVPQPDSTTGRQEFAALVATFKLHGYLDRDFDDGEPCAYKHPDLVVGKLAPVLEQRLERPALWPLRPESWDEDTFYGLIEVFHDLVARPRSYSECQGCIDGHFWGFDTDAGRRVYRSKINRLLKSTRIELRLAEHGDDTDRLVHIADEGRAQLVERALASPDPNVASGNAHAIALFRGRNANEEHKRSAIVKLASVLEERRGLLKESLFRKDEGVLFQIANEFDLRHRNEKQRTDFDPVFLDWIFWWYLATVELTDRLLARQTSAAAP